MHVPFFDIRKLFKPFSIYFDWHLSSSFCSRGHMVWKMMFEEFQDGCKCWTLFDILMEWFQLFCVTYLPHTKFLLKRIYGLEDDDVWIIPGWLFSARQSLICKWDHFSYFWVSMLPEAFNKVSAQEDIWFWRRWWSKNFKMAV